MEGPTVTCGPWTSCSFSLCSLAHRHMLLSSPSTWAVAPTSLPTGVFATNCQGTGVNVQKEIRYVFEQPSHHKCATYEMNVVCFVSVSVSLEFSTNQGRSWSLLHTECLPELCSGPHLPHSTVYSSDNYSGYKCTSVCMCLCILFQFKFHVSIFFSADGQEYPSLCPMLL